MKIRNLFFSLLAAFAIVFSVVSCTMIGDEIEENKSSFFTLAIRARGSRSSRSSSTTYTPVDIVTNFTESQFRETVTRFVIKINNEPEIIASLGSAVESKEEYPIGSQVTVSYTAYGNIEFDDENRNRKVREVIIASETQTVTVASGGTNVQFNVNQGLKGATPYTVNTYDITYNDNKPSSSAGTVSATNIPNNQTGIEENTVTQISSQTPSIMVSQTSSQTSSITNSSSSTTYTFSHWLGDDGNIYQPGQNVTMTKDLNLSAQWTSEGGGSSGGSGTVDTSGGDSESPALPPPTGDTDAPTAEFDMVYVRSGANTSNGSEFNTIGEAFNAIRGYKNTNTITIQIDGEIQVSQTAVLSENRNITIQGSSNAKLIRGANFTDSLFNVGQGTLSFKDIIVDGNKSSVINSNGIDATSPLILVEGGELHIQTGTTLRNNNNTDSNIYGGAINMTDGTLTIDSNTNISITGNQAWYGGGIYVTSGTVNIDESRISGNSDGYTSSGSSQIYLGINVIHNGTAVENAPYEQD